MGIVLSGGGSGSLLVAHRAGHEVRLSWPGVLPAPTLQGSTATYLEVLPGVDLVMTVYDTGFGEVLVVKDRAAALNPALRRLAFGTSLKGLRWRERGGGVEAVDAGGGSVLGVSRPLMWDSSALSNAATQAGRLRSDAAGPAAGARVARMQLDVTESQLAIQPDLGLLTNPAATFPLYLDPTIGYNAWTMINSFFPNQSYWAYDRFDCQSIGYAGDCAKVGYIQCCEYGPTVRYRSLFQFPTSDFRGRQVISAQFTIDLLYSFSCSDVVTQLRQVHAELGPGTTWNSNAGAWDGVVSATVSSSSCTAGRKLTEFSSDDMKNRLQSVADGSDAVTTWGLMAENESGNSGWKKFDARTAKLIVGVNTVPNMPTNVTADNRACAAGASRPFLKTVTPTLRANVSDADGDSMTGSFEYGRIRVDGSYGPMSQALQQGSVPSGGIAQVGTSEGVLDNGDRFVATGDWDRDGQPDVLAKDAGGDLYIFPGRPGGTLLPRSYIGNGWNALTIAGSADWDHDGHLDIVARKNSTGELFLYPGQSTRTPSSQPPVKLASGWNGFTFAGLADWDRDGHMDVVARQDGTGDLWLYPGTSVRGLLSQPRAFLGGGWFGFTYFGAIDWDRDGKPDVIARDPSSGQLWLYPGSGTRAPYSGTPGRFQIDSGWNGFTALTTPDVNGDGKADIVAEQSGVTSWFGYPGSGARSQGGSRWTLAVRGLSSDGRYAFHAFAWDGHAWSPASAWCEFEIDTVNPAVPTVTGDVYLEGPGGCPGGACGSVGQTGRFTFSSSADVTSFKWGFSDPPTSVVNAPTLGGAVSVDWTPTSGGFKTLYVAAVDRAGNEATRSPYQFFVAPPSPAVARWKLNDYVGSTVLADSTGNDRWATIFGATLGVPGRIAPGPDGVSRSAVQFDGVDDYAATTAAVTDTSKSFSVSAWVKLNAKGSADQSAFTQLGTVRSAFYLGYDGAVDRWMMKVPSHDATTPAPTWWSARSSSVPQVGVWTHLVGMYDSAAKTTYLYVNGVLEGTQTGVTAWNAGGPLRIGGSATVFFNGVVADARVWSRVVSTAEITDMVNPLVVGLVGRWDLEEVGPGPAFDSSDLVHDLSFYNGAQIPPTGPGHTGTGLLLDGVDDYAATDDPVVYTDQSFTVSVWARLPAGVAGNRTVVAQHGNVESGFYLKYEASDGHWYFVYGDADGTTGTGRYVRSAAPATLDTWVHLVGVYDAQTRQIKLFVNDALQGTAAVTMPWHAAGPVGLGRLKWRGGFIEHWSGSIDEVRVYQGVVGDVTRIS